MKTRNCWTLLIAIAIVGACGVSYAGHVTRSTPFVAQSQASRLQQLVRLVVHTVYPHQADHFINSPDRQEYAYLMPGVRSNGKLLVFFPGSGGQPSGYTKVMTEAASLGYHVVGVDYPNDHSMGSMCGNDLDCYGKARQEVFTGVDQSSVVTVTPNNSIYNRLFSLLAYLYNTYPTEGWGDFLHSGRPVWSKMALAGHSQGGGFAAFIAKRHEVARVVMFSSVDDAESTATPTPAHWVTGPEHATPRTRYFGFAHTGDHANYPKARSNWTALGMDALGAAVLADNAAPPYGGTHELISSTLRIVEAAPPHNTIVFSNPHNAIITDSATPIVNGVPYYRNEWRYVLGQ